MESTILLFTNVCVSEITAINMSLTKEDIIKGLKEVTRKLDKIDSSTMGIVEKFLKNFPPPTTKSARNLSQFPAELLQLIFSTYLFVTSSLLCWCARGGKVLLRTRSCGRTKSLFLKKARTWPCPVLWKWQGGEKYKPHQSYWFVQWSGEESRNGNERISWTERIGSWRWVFWACWSFSNRGSFSTAFQECIFQPGEDKLVKHQSNSRAALFSSLSPGGKITALT